MSGPKQIVALSVAALTFLVISEHLAAAQTPPGTLIERAKTDWKDQEYERAIKRVDQALASGRVSRSQRKEALRIKASAHAVLGDKAKATSAFEALLTLDPQFRLPRTTSPRIRGVFAPTRARWLLARETELRERLGADLAALQLRVAVVKRARGGLPLPVSVTLTDPKRLAKELLVFYRRRGQLSYSRVRARARGARTNVRIPAVFTASKKPYVLDLFVEVMHTSGLALRRKGSATAPLAVAMTPGQVPVPTPLYKKWWFWLGATALAVTVPLLVDQAIDVGPQSVTGTRK